MERATEDALKGVRAPSSDNLAASIIESADDAIYAKGADGTVATWNKGAEVLYGYSAEEMIGRTISVLIPEDRRGEEDAILQSVLAGKLVDNYETERLCKDGTPVRVSISATPLRDANNVIVGAVTIARNTTEHYRAALMFRGLVESAPDAIVIAGTDGKIVLVNRQTEELFGYRREELIGREVEILVPDHLRERHLGHRADFFGDPLLRPMGMGLELTGRRRDGTLFPIEVSLSPFEAEAGMLVSAAIRDITERRRAATMFRGLLESAPDAMVIVDTNGKIVLVNRQTEELFGYEREELIGHEVEALVPERLRDRHTGHRNGFFDTAQVRPMGVGLELLGVRRDGTEFPIEVSLSPVETDAATLVSAAIRDITDRKKAEAELERANQALVQNERLSAVGQMATVIGHELRNPLGAATNAVFLIRQRLGDIDDEDLQRHLAMVERETNRAATLAEDLTAYMRERTPDPCAFDPRPVLRDVLEATPAPKGVNVSVDCEVMSIYADPDQFVRIVTNVVTNAYQAMGKGGGDLHMAAVSDDSAFTLTVADTGDGIGPDGPDRLFEPFFTTRSSGTGLGLVIVKRLVEAHKGTVSIADRETGGALVTITLPLEERAAG